MNELRPRQVTGSQTGYISVSGAEEVAARCAQYLHDESRLQGGGVSVVHFPASTEQVAAAVRSAGARGHRVAVSGGRTGLTGGAVPEGCQEIISLERLTPTPVVLPDGDGGWSVRVGAGTTVGGLEEALKHGTFECPGERPGRPLFYPVDTTEPSAQIGGTIATNASGARTLHYGPTRRWVKWIRAVMADGRVLDLRRGQVRAEGGILLYAQEDGRSRELRIPDLKMPPTKNTAGYYLKGGMDAIDLFIGSEGTLGIITEAELGLVEKPEKQLFLTLFLEAEETALRLVEACLENEGIAPLALEHLGPNALMLLRRRRSESGARSEVPPLPESAQAALYLEFAFEEESDLDRLYAELLEMFSSLGVDPRASWAGFSEKILEEMKTLRHALPEAVNAIIGQRKAAVPELRKFGTDMAVPAGALRTIMRFYRTRLEESGMEYVVFGHIGDGHLHVNMLPHSTAEMEQAGALYTEFAREVVRLGGSVAAEHGIGRIKRTLLPLQFSETEIASMRDIKRALDPQDLLNPGVIFD